MGIDDMIATRLDASGDSAADDLALLPRPRFVERRPGAFALGPNTVLRYSRDATDAAALVRDWLGQPTGHRFEEAPAVVPAGDDEIRLIVDPALDIPGEGYRLSVTTGSISIRASGPRGLGYGAQTLRQLLPAAIFALTTQDEVSWTVPCVEIEDAPRFVWRGAMLDVARWYLPIPFLERFVDLLAMHRLNVLHLHLTDDQGWRFEVEKYPRLSEIGAWRTESMRGHKRDGRFDGTPHGGSYTQAELRSLVAYAARRGVTIVPEIELPGHTTAAIAAYPWLGNRPSVRIPVSTRWGIHETVLNTDDATLRFFQDVTDELLGVFPGTFIHLGGDECPTSEWEASPGAARRARDLGMPGTSHIQRWFTTEMAAFLARRGRRLVCWDEALEEPVSDRIAGMCWRSDEAALRAIARGHEVVMAPTHSAYFDMYQSAEPGQPLAFGGLVTLEDVYRYEPIPAAIRGNDRDRVLGIQGQLWGEYMPTPDRVEDMAFPRLAALAEVAWSESHDRYRPFLRRLERHLTRLDRRQVRYRPLGPEA